MNFHEYRNRYFFPPQTALPAGRLALIALFLLLLAPLHARAAEPQPGDACTAAHQVTHVGGPENAGTGYILVCDSSAWKTVVEWSTATGSSLFQVNNDAGSCTAAKQGRLRYNGTSWSYCTGSAWTAWTGLAGPTCVRRTNNVNAASVTVSCSGGEVMTGGGCSSSNRTLRSSYPSAAATWSCVFDNSDSSHTAYAVCCTF